MSKIRKTRTSRNTRKTRNTRNTRNTRKTKYQTTHNLKKTRKPRKRQNLKGGSSPSHAASAPAASAHASPSSVVPSKIQYVYISAHGHISNPETELAYKNPAKLIEDLDRRILVNAYCSNFAPTFNTENNYLQYLLDVHAKDSLDVLWNINSEKQKAHFKEMHKILVGPLKEGEPPITHLSRNVVHTYSFNYDENIQYDNITFGIYLFTDNIFKDITEDIYLHTKGKKIIKKYVEESSFVLGTTLLSPQSYGYEYESKKDKRSITLTSEQIIRYFKDKGFIVRLISNSCRGTPMKSKKYNKLEKQKKGHTVAQKLAKNAGPSFDNNAKRTLSGATSDELTQYVKNYVPPNNIKYIVENMTNGKIYTIIHPSLGSIIQLKEEVHSKSGIKPSDQYYFTDKSDYKSELVLDYSTIRKVLAKKYGHYSIDNILSKPIHLYLVDHKTYSKPKPKPNFKDSMIPLYPKIPSNLEHLLDPPLYPAYF